MIDCIVYPEGECTRRKVGEYLVGVLNGRAERSIARSGMPEKVGGSGVEITVKASQMLG